MTLKERMEGVWNAPGVASPCQTVAWSENKIFGHTFFGQFQLYYKRCKLTFPKWRRRRR